jgi:hypothetical protein
MHDASMRPRFSPSSVFSSMSLDGLNCLLFGVCRLRRRLAIVVPITGYFPNSLEISRVGSHILRRDIGTANGADQKIKRRSDIRKLKFSVPLSRLSQSN